MLLQPRREALVELGARRLRQRVVGGVADQQMAEAEAVLARELRPVRSDQLLADERRQAGASPASPPGERLDGAPVEDLALDRHPARARCRSAGSSWSRRAASSACRVGGTTTSSCDSAAIASISSTKSGLPPAARAILSRRSPRSRCGMSSSTSSVGRAARAEASPARWDGVQRTRAEPCRRSRIGAPTERSATCSIRSRNVFLAPLDVVEDNDERPLGGGVLERLAEGPSDLLAGRRRFCLAEQRPDRGRGGLVRRQDAELLQHLDDRPVGDALAVGKAARRARPSLRSTDQELRRRAATCRRRHRRRP